jgi:nitrogenase iron protein NifH
MVKIAFYGKGGIGKSTTVSNIAIALAQKGLKVMQVGCDPKADSTRLLRAGKKDDIKEDISDASSPSGLSDISEMIRNIRRGTSFSIMDHIRSREPFTPAQIVTTGYAGVLCAEAGGPLPGQGCAGRAVITALEKMEEIGVYDLYKPDVVLYDVLGDVVCGGFAMPMRKGYADHVFVLTSGETMSLYAAANIGLALENFQGRGYARLSGIILNRRDVPDEDRRVAALAEELGVSVTGTLSRSPMVLRAEEEGKCLLAAFPDSEMAQEYRQLARAVASETFHFRG